MAHRIRLTLVLLALFSLTACGAVQRVRIYAPVDANAQAVSKEWGDGLATADSDVCLWIASHTLDSHDVMWAGPILVPLFPVGAGAEAIEGERDPAEVIFTWLSVFPGPGTPADFQWNLDPANVLMTFENGDSIKPSTVALVEYGVVGPNEPKRQRNAAYNNPRGHLEQEPLAYFQAPEAYFGWAQFVIGYTRPAMGLHPVSIAVRNLDLGQIGQKNFEFSLEYVEKRRYVYSGKSENNEFVNQTPADPCVELNREAGLIDAD